MILTFDRNYENRIMITLEHPTRGIIHIQAVDLQTIVDPHGIEADQLVVRTKADQDVFEPLFARPFNTPLVVNEGGKIRQFDFWCLERVDRLQNGHSVSLSLTFRVRAFPVIKELPIIFAEYRSPFVESPPIVEETDPVWLADFQAACDELGLSTADLVSHRQQQVDRATLPKKSWLDWLTDLVNDR